MSRRLEIDGLDCAPRSAVSGGAPRVASLALALNKCLFFVLSIFAMSIASSSDWILRLERGARLRRLRRRDFEAELQDRIKHWDKTLGPRLGYGFWERDRRRLYGEKRRGRSIGLVATSLV